MNIEKNKTLDEAVERGDILSYEKKNEWYGNPYNCRDDTPVSCTLTITFPSGKKIVITGKEEMDVWETS